MDEIVLFRDENVDNVLSKHTKYVVSIKGFDSDVIMHYQKLAELKKNDDDGRKTLAYLKALDKQDTLSNVHAFVAVYDSHAALYFISNPDPNVTQFEDIDWYEVKGFKNVVVRIHVAFRNAQQDSYSIYYNKFNMDYTKSMKMFYLCRFPHISTKLLQLNALFAKKDYYLELQYDCLEFCKNYMKILLDWSVENKEDTIPILRELKKLHVSDHGFLEATSRNHYMPRIVGQSYLGKSYLFNFLVQVIVSVILLGFYHYLFRV